MPINLYEGNSVDRFVGSWQVFYAATGRPVQNSEDEDDLLVVRCVKLSDLELACSSTNKAGRTQETSISWDGVDTVKVKLERGPDVEGVYDGVKTITWKSPSDKKWIRQNTP